MAAVTFIGTGNFLAPGRNWNSFVLDGTILVEPSPTALPGMRRAGIAAADLEVIVISHFHADHTFGWPFLLLEMLRSHPGHPTYIVGPPNVDGYITELMRVGGVLNIHEEAKDRLDLRYVEVDTTPQQAGHLTLRGVPVEHVPHLRCFGYLFELGGRTVAYSGDTHPCEGLDELARSADSLILECSGRHPTPIHMDVDAVRALRRTYPELRIVLTHVGADVKTEDFTDVVVANDFDSFADL